MKEKAKAQGAFITLAAVFFGGAAGAGIRAGFGFLSRGTTWPWVIFAINLSGAFLLGLLDSLVAKKSSDHPGLKRFASFAGTGMMGAFTTYGTFVDQTRGLWLSSSPYAAVAYALASLASGVFLAGFGLYLGRKIFKAKGAEK